MTVGSVVAKAVALNTWRALPPSASIHQSLNNLWHAVEVQPQCPETGAKNAFVTRSYQYSPAQVGARASWRNNKPISLEASKRQTQFGCFIEPSVGKARAK
jgi:hypothetical protein